MKHLFLYLSPMNIEELREYCINKRAVTESFPFNEDILVFKVKNKIFALTSLKRWELGDRAVNLKCEPQRAITLRSEFEAIKGAFHMNKKHWNTVVLDGSVPKELVRELIDHSYNLVLKGLPKKVQNEIENL